MNSLELALMRLIVFAIFGFVFVALLVRIVRGSLEWALNQAQPVRSQEARVVAKRAEIRGTGSTHRRGRAWTSYYCTFETPQGYRTEVQVSGPEYGLLVEGDSGVLTYQGTWFRGFQRDDPGVKPRSPHTDFDDL